MKSKNIGYISIVALLSITCFLSLNLYFQQQTARDEVDIGVFPYTIGGWKGRDLEVTEREYRVLETRNLILREYVNPDGDRISIFIIYSETNRKVFHPPEVCIIGSGINIVDKRIEKIKNYNGNFISANKLYTEGGNHRSISLYCYKAANLYTNNYYLQQAYFAFKQLFQRHVRGATIRVSMPIRADEETALATLKTFMKESAKIIDSL